ncbi:DUF3631 domain-containing protein [Dokdonella fugitiva]|jgi:hypothetical protein|uniref:Uncharacterized protein DUF3631 n=1 Tax=Dokdonella fugitiva TaxID=328517 RepID=A0A4R2IEU6_9GAMM|nr:DUF3631 domain-containing protein [Dokdonella fugitiva]TCO41185.1 uncharacterized protein DUF3631 [Dokdonella fugitiva]
MAANPHVSRVEAEAERRLSMLETAKRNPRPLPRVAVATPTLPANDSGEKVLADVTAFLRRFVAYPNEHAHAAHALWIAHTHLMDMWDSTPRLAFLSPEPGSGKSRALEVTALLVPHPVEAVNVTPAYLFRKVGSDEGRPTILYDEIDTVFGPKAKENEEIRGLLNAGHRKHSKAGRCVVRGKEVFTEEIPAYCAVALAGLGDLPDTILTRAVIVRMRRRAPSETVEPYRHRVHSAEGDALAVRLAAWMELVGPRIQWPELPDGINDRDADVWEPLIAVADAAGGDWPKRARASAVALLADAKRSAPSLGIQLLADLRRVFGEDDALTTQAVLDGLCAIEESPWGDLRGKPLDNRGLSHRLRPYGIASRTLRVGSTTAKGYRRTDLHDAWERYLPASLPQPDSAVTRVTAVTTPPTVTDVTDVSQLDGNGGDDSEEATEV